MTAGDCTGAQIARLDFAAAGCEVKVFRNALVDWPKAADLGGRCTDWK